MSVEDLQNAGLLRPPEQWDGGHPVSHVSRTGLIVSLIVACLGAAMIYLGNGGWLTWTGLGLFALGLAGFTVVAVRGIHPGN